MYGLNRAMIMGCLGKDPERKQINDGTICVTFSVATSSSYKDKHGQKKETTEWHNIVVWSQPLAKICYEHLRKGSQVYLEGEIKTRRWEDKDGGKHSRTEICLTPFNSQIRLLDVREDRRETNRAREENNNRQSNSQAAQKTSAEPDFGDDEIPF